MAKYKCEVATITPYLRCRTSYGRKPNNITSKRLYTGDTFICSTEPVRCSEGLLWYKNDATGYWSASADIDGSILLKVTVIGESPAKEQSATNNQTSVNKYAVVSNVTNATGTNYTAQQTSSQQLNGVLRNNDVSATSDTGTMGAVGSSYTKGYDIINSMNFPVNKGTANKPVYDYTTNVNGIRTDNVGTTGEQLIQEIKENLNIFSGWDKLEINNKYHTEFNRFKMDHPDIFLKNSVGYIVFTRPDLNLLNNGVLNEDIAADPRVEYIARQNMHLVQSLTHEYDGTTGHNFNPFLTNLAQGIDVVDDSVDVLDTGETFTGYKFQYSKHNIKSITSGNLNIKFKETFDLGITNIFQLWVDYQSDVYKGIILPKEDYIWYKNVDYMCNVYYFLLDQDGETVLFWSKYFGVFPTNVPKSAFSYDIGSPIQLPELQVSFSYIYKEDLSPATLVEFNRDAGLSNNSNVSYLPIYNATLGHSGKTWSGVPFVTSYTGSNGITNNSNGFKLRFRSPNELSKSVSYGQSDAYSASSYKNTLSASDLSDRELVRRVAGLQDNTMEYIDKWDWSTELYRKTANAIRNQSAAGSTGDNMSIVQQATGLQDNSMEYLKNWTWGDELTRKLAEAMKNGV